MAAHETPASLVVSKLVARGRESAAMLEALIRCTLPTEQQGRIGNVAAEIVRSFDRVLSALHGGSASGRKRKSVPGRAATQLRRPKRRTRASSGVPATRVEKKWTSEDGFMWRKYGQKQIRNSSHPRLYFRCSYKQEGGCLARRQVQQSEDDTSIYMITYFGDHTCGATVADVRGNHVEMQPPFAVINFGSSLSVSLPEGGDKKEELAGYAKTAKMESTSSDPQLTAELASSAHVSGSSAADPLTACLLDSVTQLFSFVDNARLYYH